MIFKITDRLITQTLADPTASGRTDQWQGIIDAVTQMNLPTLIRQFFFGKNPTATFGGEGLPNFFALFGLPCTIAFYTGLIFLVIICWKNVHTKTIALAILCVIVAFCVDQSYLYPPCVMNVYLFFAATQKLTYSYKSGKTHSKITNF